MAGLINAWAGWNAVWLGGGTITTDTATGIRTFSGAAGQDPRQGLLINLFPGDIIECAVMARARSGKGHLWAALGGVSGPLLAEVPISSEDFRPYRFRAEVPFFDYSSLGPFAEAFVCAGLFGSDNVSSEVDFCAPRAGLIGGPQFAPGGPVRVHKGGEDQTIPPGVITKLTWSTAEIDPDATFDDTNDRVIPCFRGIYRVHVMARFKAGVDQIFSEIRITRNGGLMRSSAIVRPSGTDAFTLETEDIMRMSGTTDYVEALVQQNSGGDLDVDGTSSFTKMIVQRIGLV